MKTKLQKERLSLLIDDGMTLQQIGELYGVSRMAIYDNISSLPEYIAYRALTNNRRTRNYLPELNAVLKQYRDEQKIVDRFWSQVNKQGCWEWTGYCHPVSGYGVFQCKELMDSYKVSRYTHQQSWCMHNGPIPEGKQINHKCHNPACVNPDHLYLGTQADNMRDRDEKKLGIDRYRFS